MTRYINRSDATRTVKAMLVYITEDHEGVQIQTQWDTGIKSCQISVLCTDKQYFYFISYCFYCFVIIKILNVYIMYKVEDYYVLYNNSVSQVICAELSFYSHLCVLLSFFF